MNPEFYEDEVIEGFYVPSMLKKAWGAQMDVLKETDAICKRHDIPYFADWGTLLSAIRHGGYIP
ncbi:MAG: LicD family protein [Lachnospiraceae bacterium]|nr:LicD family protein [Lachnospiraceae bacterium]